MEYKSNYNTEGYELEKLDVNGCDGFYIEMGDLSILVWDNGDYILSLEGTFTKDELIELAKSVKIREMRN